MDQDSRLRMQVQCPLPKTEFDHITLGHGSGGLLTHQLLDSGVFDILSNEHLDREHDGAILSLDGPVAMSTDSFVISPILFPGGNIGELSVFGTVNDLAMCGAVPAYLSLGFVIEEGLSMHEFWEILLGIRWAAERSGVQIVTGDTKVVDKGKGDKIFINTTGVGSLLPEASIAFERLTPGDQIICSGPIATHGMAIMSVREGLEFESDIESDTVNLNEITADLIRSLGAKVKFLRDPTRGGLGTILAEIAKKSELGFCIHQESLPIRATVASACELLGLDPLYVANEGVFIAIVENGSQEQALSIIGKHEQGKKAAHIGEITTQHPGKAILTSKIGGQRVINLPVGEQLPRIC